MTVLPPDRAARALPLIQATRILPHPTLTEVAVAKMSMPDGSHAVVLQFVTATGAQLFFLEEVVAKHVHEQIGQCLGSGIVVVPAGAVPPAPRTR